MTHPRALVRYATVAYADIFDYPLTASEIHYWSIGSVRSHTWATVSLPAIHSRRGMYVLSGRHGLITKRIRRKSISSVKWDVARRMASMLWYIPTILLVGVTGGLAMDNTDDQDDIDLFIVTRTRSLWISRLLAVVLFDLMGVRRKPHQVSVANKVCLNMFVSEDAIGVGRAEQDLFTAHEVLQMVPLWERGGMYRKFLEKNRWVNTYLPNAWKEKIKIGKQPLEKMNEYRPLNVFLSLLCVMFEYPARFFQLWYMRKRRTNEIITQGMLRFHPQDARIWIKTALAKRLSRYNIPLDNIFYDR